VVPASDWCLVRFGVDIYDHSPGDQLRPFLISALKRLSSENNEQKVLHGYGLRLRAQAVVSIG
jgi:hypothetical protein